MRSTQPGKNNSLYNFADNVKQNNNDSQSPEKQNQSNNQNNISQLNKTWSGPESQDRYISYLRDQNLWLKSQLSSKEQELSSSPNQKSLYPPQFRFSFAQAQYNRLLGEFQEVKNELDNLKKDADEKVKKSNLEMEKLQKENDELQTENQNIKDQLEKAKKEVQDINKKCSELLKLSEQSNQEKNKLQDEIKQLKSQLKEAQKIKSRSSSSSKKDTKDSKDSKDNKDTKGDKDTKDAKGNKDTKDTKAIKSNRDTKGNKDAKDEDDDVPTSIMKVKRRDCSRYKSVHFVGRSKDEKEDAPKKKRRNHSESNEKRKGNEETLLRTSAKSDKDERRSHRRSKSERSHRNDNDEINENKNNVEENDENVKERNVEINSDKNDKNDNPENEIVQNEDKKRKRSPSPTSERSRKTDKEIRLLKSALKAQTEGKKDLEEKVKDQEDMISQLKMDLMLTQVQKDELKSTNEKLKTKNETSQNEVDHILKLFNNQTLESKQLSTEVAQLRNDLEEKEQLINKLKSNIINGRKLEKRINKLELDNEHLNSKNQLLEYENTTLKDELNMQKNFVQQGQFYQPCQQQQPNIKQKNIDINNNNDDSDDSFLRKNEANVKELIQRLESLSDKFNKDSQQKSKQIDELGKKVTSLKESQNKLAKNIESKSNA